jgi:hypothetical protein
VEAELRRAFNASYSDARYARYMTRLEKEVGSVAFRLAETPVFLPPALANRLERYAREILAELSQPARIERMRAAVPGSLDVPRLSPCDCAQVDFAIVRGEDGELDGRVVELQGFPSLYAFTTLQAAAWADIVRDECCVTRPLSPYFGLSHDEAIAWLRRVVLADHDPANVVLVDLTPRAQKTWSDFAMTERLVGVEAVDITDLRRDGRTLYRQKDGKSIPVRRIFNRVVFDELEIKKPNLDFAFTDDLDVTWCSHPNWYWIWSKFSLPHLSHRAIPRARLLADVTDLPADLSRYVLKPLFSFAGSGVIIDVTREAIDQIPPAKRAFFLIQEKIAYARDLPTVHGAQVAVEIRVMCLRDGDEIRPAWNLARLSRGKMHGVDHNRELDWVGSSVALF